MAEKGIWVSSDRVIVCVATKDSKEYTILVNDPKQSRSVETLSLALQRYGIVSQDEIVKTSCGVLLDCACACDYRDWRLEDQTIKVFIERKPWLAVDGPISGEAFTCELDCGPVSVCKHLEGLSDTSLSLRLESHRHFLHMPWWARSYLSAKTLHRACTRPPYAGQGKESFHKRAIWLSLKIACLFFRQDPEAFQWPQPSPACASLLVSRPAHIQTAYLSLPIDLQRFLVMSSPL